MIRVSLLVVLLVLTQAFQIGKRTAARKSDLRGNNYPIRAAYIDRSEIWSGDAIASAMAVPGYAPYHQYNYIFLAFWRCTDGPVDLAKVWAQAADFYGGGSSFGSNTPQIQQKLRKIYNDAGVKVMVTAFGSTEMATTLGLDPTVCAQKLGQFVLDNNLDGTDIDWQDNEAMNKGLGENWLITFTRVLRDKIPDKIISHAPQAPYFKASYPGGGYKAINDQVGDKIDFYNVQFYNQLDDKFDSYEQLFTHALGGDSVLQISARGVPLNKIVVGKPVLPSDSFNTGYVNQSDLGSWAARAFDELGWYGGIMHWQYPSDKTGGSISAAAGPLIQKCQQSGKCQ